VRSTQPPVETDVGAVTADVVRSIVDRLDVEGTHAVIAPAARCAELSDLGAIDVIEAKGLEFDAVVVVDPEGIAAEGEGGARRVYVALTRTTTLLHVVRETR
jgi:DNA helicase IV